MSARSFHRRLLPCTIGFLLIGWLALHLSREAVPPGRATGVTEKQPLPPTALVPEIEKTSHPTAVRAASGFTADRPIQLADGQTLVLALDEAVIRHPADGEKLVPLVPPATPATLGSRLAALDALPVAYPPDAERGDSTRRILTADLRVQLDSNLLAALLRRHPLTLKDRPTHAPGWAILSAVDPLAALAILGDLRSDPAISQADVLTARKRFKRALPNDPLVPQQWHLANTNITRTHANLENAWLFGGTGGVRGTGVRIGIIDDGIQNTHPDFAGNIDTLNDRDWLDGTPDDASAKQAFEDFHGTACAGVAAARGNNTLGVSGAAPAATLVGLRLISDESSATDAHEAEAIGWKNDIIQIKSNSWGPEDDGVTLEGPEPLTAAALAAATTTGRGGKGSIIIWAGGNGRSVSDNSNFDGYANSIHTIAVTATNSLGAQASYAEPGANLIVSAPSSGGGLQITTTDLSGTAGYNTASGTAGDYDSGFGGTSAATPLVAGIAALMLEKNPDLGWRDVQEILIRSAHQIAPTDADWATNAAGLRFNHKFGAGLVDATAAVNLAATWQPLPPQTSTTAATTGLPITIPDNSAPGITRTFTVTENLRVEHVTLRLSITHPKRRDLEISLTSPSGMVSRLAEPASRTGANFANWTFSSVRHWGEFAPGTWTLHIADRISANTGSLTTAELKLFGTPAAATNQPPVVTAATLDATSQGYADTPLSVASTTASDPEGDPITFAYQWQSSTDGLQFSPAPHTTATLPPDPANSAKLWRCLITPSDPISAGPAFATAAVNLLTRPPATAAPGDPFSYTSGLILPGTPPGFSRPVILNEFSQGPSGGTAEWVELLTLQQTNLRYWDLSSGGRILVFQDTAVWENLPPGTLIVIYNGKVAKDPTLPPDNANPANGPLVLSSTNTTWFDPDPDFDAWLDLSNTGDLIELNDADSSLVHALSYGSNTTYPLKLGTVGGAQSAHFTGGQESDADFAGAWTVTTHTVASPGAGNSPANTAYIQALRDGSLAAPAQFRLATGTTVPAGLALDPATGTLAGTIAPAAPTGTYPITIERYNAQPATVSQSFTLTLQPEFSYASWIAGHPSITDPAPAADPDADGLPNLVEYALDLDPTTPQPTPPITFEATPTGISLTYRINTAHADVTLTPEWSATLDAAIPWATSEIQVNELEATPPNRLLRATLPVTPAEPRRYLRLRATLTGE